MPFILFIVVIYVGFELADSSYITSFYDATTHFNRGLFVAVTGHSNPSVDLYFDVQPGFFWATAILSSVCGVSLTSFVNSMSIFVV
jgi:hypothetical protein